MIPRYSTAHARSPIYSFLKVALLTAAFGLLSDSVGGVSTAHGQPGRVPSDFNGDGISELVVISTDRTLVWNQIDPHTGISSSVGRLGVVGDHVIMADWLGLGTPQIGVTRVERGSRYIVWRVRDTRGLVQELQFGESGDTVVAGVDLDGSGAADAIVVRRERRQFKWLIHFDPFVGGTTVSEFIFGSPSNQLLFINMDGTGPRLAAKAKNRNGDILRLLNPLTGAVKVFRNLPNDTGNARYKLSMPLRSPSGQEVVASVSVGKRRTFISIIDPTKKSAKARLVKKLTLNAVGDIAYGNFLDNVGFEVAIKTAGGVLIGNPFDGTTVNVATGAGVLVDELNINRMGTTGAPASTTPKPGSSPATPTPAPTGPAPADPPSNGLTAVCSSISTIQAGQMLIKSEISNHIHGGDSRATGYTVVCAAQCPSQRDYVPFYYSDGVEAGAVGYYGTFSGNGKPRYYGAAGSAPQHFVSEIAPEAARRGNGRLYLSLGNGECKEFAPIGRNGSL